MKIVIGLVAALLALAAGCGGSVEPRDTAQQFVTAMQEYNFGVACSLISDEQLAPDGGMSREDAIHRCAYNYNGNVGYALVTGGVSDPFAGTQILEGYEVTRKDGSHVLTLIDCSGRLGAQDVIIRDGQIDGFETQTGLTTDSGNFEKQCSVEGQASAGGHPIGKPAVP